ncbi:hypothetical protein HN873_041926 [Arachis hypogaea]
MGPSVVVCPSSLSLCPSSLPCSSSLSLWLFLFELTSLLRHCHFRFRRRRHFLSPLLPLKLKEHMQYCINHPEEISKLAKVQNQVSEVKGVMIENIEKVHTDALQVAIYRHCPHCCVNWLMAI